ncbi:MAG: LysR family transcriptional regulator [Gammaproteobacteria bacterium]|nr:LysR family transcriptional regulator [Gammaproteobacteria bacterium]
MRFTLRQLQYFVAAGEVGSIRQAAERISVSQPSISSAISQLEKEFGIQLFIRHHAQGLSLTTMGEAMLREARLFLAHAEELGNLAQHLSGSVAGELRVACFGPLAPFVIPTLCHGFAARYADVELDVVEAHQETILDFLYRGSTDIAFTYDLDLPEDLEFEPLVALEPYVVLSQQHRLARRRTIRLDELVELPLVLLDLPLSKDYFLSLFERYQLQPTILTRTSQPEVMRSLVGQGYGYSLANVKPQTTMSLDGSDLVYIALKGEHRALRAGLLSPYREHQSRLLDTFQHYVGESLQSGRIPGML